jgi:hypothetical protein
MGTPIEELSEPDLHPPAHDPPTDPLQRRPAAAHDDEKQPAGGGGDDGDATAAARQATMERLTTNFTTRSTADERLPSPGRAREAANRLGDDLAVLQAERKASSSASADRRSEAERREPPFRRRSREMDGYDLEPSASERTSAYRVPERPNTGCGMAFRRVRDSVWLVRYFMYIMPVFLVLLVPVLLGLFVFQEATVGDVRLLWFSIWLEIVWLSLWAARVSRPLLR